MLLEVRRETEGHFLVGTVILGFLSIFKKSQASSPFEALNSARLSRCQRDLRPPVHMRRRPRAFSRVSTVDSVIPSSCEMKDEPPLLSSQGISVSTPLDAANSGSLSYTYSRGKPRVEVLVESWPTSSIESLESPLFSKRYGVHGAFLEFLR